MEANKILFHSSSNGLLMVEPRTKSETISETTKSHLLNIWIEEKYNRRKNISNKFLDKGNAVEEDSMTLYSLLKKQMFTKNNKFFENDFICGTPDIINGDTVIDIKSSWDIFTFFAAGKSLNKDYMIQLQCYMELTGCTRAVLAYCLVNATPKLIEDAKRRAAYDVDILSEDFTIVCKKIEMDMIFDYALFRQQNPKYDLHTHISEWLGDIPKEERVIEFSFERDNVLIESIYKRVAECRTWIQTNLIR